MEFRERRLRQVRAAHVLAAAGGLTTLIAGGFLLDEFGPGALLGVLAGLAMLAGGITLATRLGRTVRYRIDKPNSTAVLSGKVAALLAGFFGVVAILSAVDAPSAPRSVVVVVLVGSLAVVVNAHAARWTLFQVDATGLRVGRAGVPWPAVARIDVAAAGPGAVEVGVQLVAGQVVNGTPVPGTVLSDLPVCTLLPADALRMDRLTWAVREFGNPAVPVVPRDQPRPPAPPVPLTRTPAIPAVHAPLPPAPPTPSPTDPTDHTDAQAATAPPEPSAAEDPGPATEATIQVAPPADTETTDTETTDHIAGPPKPAAAPTPPPGVPAPYPATPPPGIPAYPGAPLHTYQYAPPPPRKRPWLIAGAVVLAAVLVGGAVTAVALTGDDDPGHGTAAESADKAPKYSAARAGEPCDLIDVYVLKRWSTETKIVTEPSADEHPDYDYLHCGAHSDSEYLVGRVTHLELVVAVAEDARAARAFEKQQRGRGVWTANGDVQEQGEVADLAESAEFEQAVSTYGDHTRADYVLRVRDDNLVFILKYGSDADQTDGVGVTVDTLADTARQQARVAMEKLRARPAAKEKKTEDDEPAVVPEIINDAATLPSTENVMARVRGADPCELHDRAAMATYGTRIEVEPKQALGLAECRLVVVAGKDRIRFRIDLNEYLSKEERADLAPENLNGLESFRTRETEGSNGCTYYVPFGRSGFGASVTVLRYVPGAENQAPWPQVCEVAGDYTATVGKRIAELPARSTPAPEPTLIGKDPCLSDEVVEALLPDWKIVEISRYYSAQCRFTVKQGDETYEIEMNFDRDAEQIGDEPASVGGLTGVWIRYEGLCSLSLVAVPETTPDTWDAHNIGVSVQFTGGYGGSGSQDVCTLAQGAAEMLINSL